VSFGQGSANTWYFGRNAGITFNTSPPTAISGGKINTFEGCATISDVNGDLLFYTDGTTVYNSNHQVMLNGTGLLGDASSTQSALIIPKPLDENVYYVFTVDNFLDDVNHGVNYSIVDFRSTPLGEVTSKNIPLLNYSSEKLSAVVKGCDTETVWMVTLSSANQSADANLNTFYAFEITDAGVNTNAVTSTVSMAVNDDRGNLKFSPDGKKLACANASSGLYLMDFDSQTGRVANPLYIDMRSTNYAAYGVEFSPNNRFLYVHSSNDARTNMPPSAHFSSLFQYDLDSADIEASQVILDEQNYYRGSLQLGPDGKIYRALSANYDQGLSYLGVIEDPNEKGLAANYIDRAIPLAPGTVSFQGLPPFNQSLFNTVDVIQNDLSTSRLSLCADDTYTLKYDLIPGATYQWYRNEVIMPSETSNELNISRPAGSTLPYDVKYELKMDLNDGTCERTGIANVSYYAYPQMPSNPVELVQCEDAENSDGLSIFNLEDAIPQLTNNDPNLMVAFYVDQSRADADAPTTFNPTEYENRSQNQVLYARVKNPANCNLTVPFTLRVSTAKSISTTLDLCDEMDTGYGDFNLRDADAALKDGLDPNIEVTYYRTQMDALLKNPNAELPDIYSNQTAYNDVVYARLENNDACFDISEVNLVVNIRPRFTLPEEGYYCTNFSPEPTIIEADLTLLDASKNYSYTWLPTGQTTPYLETTMTGEHTLTVTDLSTGCSRTESINILPKGLAEITAIETTDLSENNTVTVEITGDGEFEFALDDELGFYQDSNHFENVAAGFHTVYVRSKTDCGIVSEEFSIIGFMKYFTPNGDGYNDYWQVLGINEYIQPRTKVYIFDRYGKLIKQLDPLSEGWDGTARGVLMPSDDYWFRVELQDERLAKGHFTLRR
tara:strand:+ start:1204 stop:3882 length:2679 start_codon:yes stop_codon:yes gene_type:complete